MKKILTSVLALAAVVMGFVSCQKEEGRGLKFTAVMDEQVADDHGKTAYDAANGLCWVEDDTIYVRSEDGQHWGIYTAVPQSGNPRYATFNECSELWGGHGYDTYALTNDDAPYYAVYPAEEYQTVSFLDDALLLINQGYDINVLAYLPMEYNTANGELTHFPMMAHSSTTNLQFKNSAGAIRLNLTKAGVAISRIVVRAHDGHQLSGGFDGGFTLDGEPTLTVFYDEDLYVLPQWLSDSVAVNCSANTSIANGHDFFIPIPAGSYSGLEFVIYAADGSVCTKTMNSSATVSIVRSRYSTITLGGDALEFVAPEAAAFGCLPGFFSVSATEQVRFASGNLQYVNGAWRFAEHQYDYLGAYSATAWDHFCWSTAATTYGMSTSLSNSDYSGAFVDWGTAIGDGTTWRTLSRYEWTYVLFDRPGADDKHGAATVAGIHGLILLPDTWTAPSGVPAFVSGYSSLWATNQYTAAEWSDMEAAGAVFLPAAGDRYGTEMGYVGTYGVYWSSTPTNEYYAGVMCFFDYYVNYEGNYNRGFGRSVRLVQDY